MNAASYQGEAAPCPLLLVEDTRLALGRLAAHWRAQFSIPVVGLTGSNGKTTVKEMLAAILALRQRDTTMEERRVAYCGTGVLADQLRAQLPFKLTTAQEHVLAEIMTNMHRPHPMNRLLQVRSSASVEGKPSFSEDFDSSDNSVSVVCGREGDS